MGSKLKYLSKAAVFTAATLLLSSCFEAENKDDVSVDINVMETPQKQTTPALEPSVATDSVKVGNLDLILLDNNGACQLDDGSQIRYMKPMAPCYFMRQASTLQQYKKDNVTVIAAVGTPLKERCGQEVQGLLIENDSVSLSARIGQGSIFCADKGLDSFHFSLF